MTTLRWLCVYCKTGIVYKLPSRCPECDKLLNEEILKKEERSQNERPKFK